MTTIAHISDLHFDRIDPPALEALRIELARVRPDVLVVSGDLTQRARAGQFRRAMAFLAGLPTPQVIVPGNHDVPLFAFWRRIFCPYGRFRRFVTDDLWPAWSNGHVRIVGMNTACRIAPRLTGFWKDGRIDRRQCDRIRRSFAGADEPVRVLVAHHPFIEPPAGHAHGIVHGATEALAAIQEAGISLILSGHVHMAYYADLRTGHPHLNRPIINLVAGSATSTRRRDPCNSFNIVEVRGDELHLRIVDLREGRWQTRSPSPR